MKRDESQTGEPESAEQHLRALILSYEARILEITEMVAKIRHDINNPLTGVIGQAQLLLREDLSDKARQRVQTIEQLATRIRDTVAQLREVQRPTRSALEDDEKQVGSRKDEG
jgi:signal transduction histidine kinase